MVDLVGVLRHIPIGSYMFYTSLLLEISALIYWSFLFFFLCVCVWRFFFCGGWGATIRKE